MSYGFQVYDQNAILVLTDKSLLLKEHSFINFSIQMTWQQVGYNIVQNWEYDIPAIGISGLGKFFVTLESCNYNCSPRIITNDSIHITVFPRVPINAIVNGTLKVYKL
jgi:hypothetical protein